LQLNPSARQQLTDPPSKAPALLAARFYTQPRGAAEQDCRGRQKHALGEEQRAVEDRHCLPRV